MLPNNLMRTLSAHWVDDLHVEFTKDSHWLIEGGEISYTLVGLNAKQGKQFHESVRLAAEADGLYFQLHISPFNNCKTSLYWGSYIYGERSRK